MNLFLVLILLNKELLFVVHFVIIKMSNTRSFLYFSQMILVLI